MDNRIPEERFWSFVSKHSPTMSHMKTRCWIWIGSGRPYGAFSLVTAGGDKKQVGAHRFAWELRNGPIPKGIYVLHRCDNPPCVRPSHLFLGTHMDNMRDQAEKGRLRSGIKHHNAKLTEAKVRLIRVLAAEGRTPIWLSARFGVTKAAIGHVISRKAWRHVV